MVSVFECLLSRAYIHCVRLVQKNFLLPWLLRCYARCTIDSVAFISCYVCLCAQHIGSCIIDITYAKIFYAWVNQWTADGTFVSPGRFASKVPV
jgi:hypothetical protein